MTVSTEPARRKRYERSHPTSGLVLSQPKNYLLETVADYRLVSLPQLASRASLPPKTVRRYMRQLFDHGLVDVVAAPRFALADADASNRPELLFGSAPNVYVLTRQGARVLERLGYVDIAAQSRSYGPRNLVYLAHELQIRSIRLWLELIARTGHDFQLERWVDGPEAALALAEPPNAPEIRPDAWCVFRFGSRALVAMVEVDRGTERADVRWRQKIDGYQSLFSGRYLREQTGYSRARVLVVAPNGRRRDQLCCLVRRLATPTLAERYWFATFSDLEHGAVTDQLWCRVGAAGLVGLLSVEQLAEALGDGRATK